MSSGDDSDAAAMLWDEVAGFAMNRPRPSARRNDPCPCGSGRKYKQCHLGRETHSLDDRAGWLYSKARRFLRVRRPFAVEDLAEELVDDDAGELYDLLLESPLLDDILLHEDGVLAEFLAARDRVLPDDEALLAAQWVLVDRGVFEIVEIGATWMGLRNVASGDEIRVVNLRPAPALRTGALVVGRPLPVGETFRAFSGVVPLDTRHLDAMLHAIDTGGVSAIADVLSVMFAPPRLSNTDGHDLVAHTIRWRVQVAAVPEALAQAGVHADGPGRWTLVRDAADRGSTVIASLWLDGTELVGEVNSSERAIDLQFLVAGALPDAEVVDVDVRPVRAEPAPA
ncbi:MAG: SEC-C domain-containing protein [Ilumatobacteraceae bacterium]